MVSGAEVVRSQKKGCTAAHYTLSSWIGGEVLFGEMYERGHPAATNLAKNVAELIDAFRLTPAETVQRAVTTGQSKWLGQILSSYGNDVASSGMLVDAAAVGYDEVVKLLLPVLLFLPHQVYWEAVLAAMPAANASASLTTLRILLAELQISGLTDAVGKMAIVQVHQLLHQAAKRGCRDAVVLIVEHAEKENYARIVGTISEAMSRAAAGGHTGVMEFLLQLDKTYWKWNLPHAVAVKRNQTAIATKLYAENPEYKGKNLFVRLARDGCTGAVEYFFPKVRSNVELLDEATLEAAKRDQPDVVAVLGTKCIPPATAQRAFVTAARNAASAVVQDLLEKYKLSAETINEGSISATEGGRYSLMQSLYEGQRISADAVLLAFKTTSTWTSLQTFKYLTGLLSDETRVPREFKHKAFVDAALTDKMKALLLLIKLGHEALPLEVLRSSRDNVRQYQEDCLQSHFRAALRFQPRGAVAKLVAEWKEESTGEKGGE